MQADGNVIVVHYNPIKEFWRLLTRPDDLDMTSNDRLSRYERIADVALAQNLLFRQTAEAHGWLLDEQTLERLKDDMATGDLDTVRPSGNGSSPIRNSSDS